MGFSIGAMLAPPIIYFAHASFGWQGAFMFTGVLALLWVILWWAFYHNPEQHPNLSKDELAFIKQDNEPAPVKLPFLTALKTVSKQTFLRYRHSGLYGRTRRAVLSFWVPLYLAKEHGMDLKQIAMFAAAVPRRRPRQRGERLPDASVYPPVRLLPRELGCRQLRDRRVPDDLAGHRGHYPRPVYHHRADLHRRLRAPDHLLHAQRPVVESFDKGQMATVNGMRGSAAWIASFLFSLLIGVTADKIGFNPLFIAMGFFDLIGALFW